MIHDLKVIGEDTGVRHQIDVHITQDGATRRILVECKDFDVSGAAVDLGIVRDFWGVVDDIHPDEAWVITCNDFTREAKKYAKGKGIKLATLRVFADSDWQGRIHTIITTFVFRNYHNDRMSATIGIVDPQEERAFAAELGATGVGIDPNNDPSQVFDGQTIRSISEIAKGLLTLPLTPTQEVVEERKVCDGWVSPSGGKHYRINGFVFCMPVSQTAVQLKLENGSAAKLLLADGEGLDFVLWDTALEAYSIDETGQVHLAPEAVQKRLITTFTPISVPGS